MLFQNAPNHALTYSFWVSYNGRMEQLLTTKTLDALKPATGKRDEVRNIKVPGLHVRVSSSGSVTFF